MIRFLLLVMLSAGWTGSLVDAKESEVWPGFVASDFDNEQVREIHFAEDARAIVVAPAVSDFDPQKPTLLLIFATPNGNTAEQTLGCQPAEGMDWHFDIQHIAAQWRIFRSLEKDRNTVLVCVQANKLSWPNWKRERTNGPQLIEQLVNSVVASIPGKEKKVVLSGHSGGGSFLFGYLDAVKTIPPLIERIIFLDANYSFESELHGEKLLNWLTADKSHQFITLAYDDRNIELDGKKVVGPTGGTYRASHRMLDFLKEQIPIEEAQEGEFDRYEGVDGRLAVLVHPNPKNIILHTRLVGEMNGLLEGLTRGTPNHSKWGKLESRRAYTEQIQPTSFDPAAWHAESFALPARRSDSPTGSAVVKGLLAAESEVREAALVEEILYGNVPESWRHFAEVSAESHDADGQAHRIVYRVAPDYLAVGSDEDFVRVPLTPYNAQLIADMLGCVLPTRKMVDEIYQTADVKLAPLPLTEDRESLSTFLQHHDLIQKQLDGQGEFHLLGGIKKDVVISNELGNRPGHVAIYGWHQLDGKPIQPLTTVHVDWYVDYSHGIRLVDQWAEVDGKPMRIHEVLRDKNFSGLLSDEGPVTAVSYRHPPAK